MPRLLPLMLALLAFLSPQSWAAESSGDTVSGRTQVPQLITFTVDAAVAGEVTAITVDEQCYKISLYFVTNAGLVSDDQTLVDGTSTLSATTGAPVAADQWFDVDVGVGKQGRAQITSLYVASLTTSTRVFAWCMGRSEP